MKFSENLSYTQAYDPCFSSISHSYTFTCEERGEKAAVILAIKM